MTEHLKSEIRDAIATLDASGFPGGFSTDSPAFDAAVARILKATVTDREDAARRVGLRQRFDALDAVIDLSDPVVFGERRELGKAVGAALDNASISAKTFPPYGENGAMTEPPARATPKDEARRDADENEKQFAELLALVPDWDGYGAPSIDEGAVHLARCIARMLRERPAIVACGRGGVQLEWHHAGLDVEIETTGMHNATVYIGDSEGAITPEDEGAPTVTERCGVAMPENLLPMDWRFGVAPVCTLDAGHDGTHRDQTFKDATWARSETATTGRRDGSR